MDSKNTMELRDESVYPDDTVLSGILGDSFLAYQALIKLFDDNHLTHEWRFYKDGKAWLGKVQKKDKTIVWMSAWKGYLQASMYIPVKYYEQILALDIHGEQKEKFRHAKNMGKSTPCTFEIRTTDILDDFNRVMQVKLAAK
jgi:hypothetical protein